MTLTTIQKSQCVETLLEKSRRITRQRKKKSLEKDVISTWVGHDLNFIMISALNRRKKKNFFSRERIVCC
jgi:hypothetical protein